jgi:hypothetical protein
MSDRAKKISELSVVTSATGSDKLILVQNSGGNSTTVAITANSFAKSFTDLKVVKFANVSYTLTSSDNGTTILVANSTSATVTVPASLPTGFNCQVIATSTGNVVIGNAAGVTIHSKPGTFTVSDQWGVATVLVYAANSAVISGDI